MNYKLPCLGGKEKSQFRRKVGQVSVVHDKTSLFSDQGDLIQRKSCKSGSFSPCFLSIPVCAGVCQLSSDILSYVSLVAELGRAYAFLLATELHPGTAQPAFPGTGTHSLFLEGCLPFTTFSMIEADDTAGTLLFLQWSSPLGNIQDWLKSVCLRYCQPALAWPLPAATAGLTNPTFSKALSWYFHPSSLIFFQTDSDQF